MKTKKYKTVIFGATFFGVSKLIKDPENCILIERASMVGSEFVDSLLDKGIKKVDIQTDFGKRFLTNLKNQEYIDEKGSIYSAPALFSFCNYIKNYNPNILFQTEVTNIEKSQEGYEVTIFNCNGFSTIKALEIIDTTSAGVLHNAINKITASKSLNLIIDKVPSKSKHNISYNPFTKQYIYQFPVELEADYITARKKLYQFWRNNMQGSCKIIMTATTFAYHMPFTKMKLSENHYWIPSCGFDNLLHAVEEGQVL